MEQKVAVVKGLSTTKSRALPSLRHPMLRKLWVDPRSFSRAYRISETSFTKPLEIHTVKVVTFEGCRRDVSIDASLGGNDLTAVVENTSFETFTGRGC